MTAGRPAAAKAALLAHLPCNNNHDAAAAPLDARRTPWPRLLEKRLSNAGMRVVEAALCSRTTRWDDGGSELSELIPGTQHS